MLGAFRDGCKWHVASGMLHAACSISFCLVLLTSCVQFVVQSSSGAGAGAVAVASASGAGKEGARWLHYL